MTDPVIIGGSVNQEVSRAMTRHPRPIAGLVVGTHFSRVPAKSVQELLEDARLDAQAMEELLAVQANTRAMRKTFVPEPGRKFSHGWQSDR